MALPESFKIDIRRHLSIPFAGIPNSGLTMGIRTMFQSGQLEFAMNNTQAAEEAVITGWPYGEVQIYGTNPLAGNTFTTTINATPVVYTVTAQDAASPSPLVVISNNAANAINQAGLGPTAGGIAVVINSPQPLLPPFSTVRLNNPTTFTLTASATGNLSVRVIANGSTYPFPNFKLLENDGTTTTLYGYVSICNYLEGAIGTISQNLGFQSVGGLDDKAAVKFRLQEPRQRIELYDYWRQRLATVVAGLNKDAWTFRGATGPGGWAQ